ncbi:hypothetical protein CNECB9_2540013 [Cupriavidus necator]|uniref:Uncharacterized protein n=1 Tax=Cupriavidus necator TaxID=106590 RepID=A0A1K0IFR7_CUPNE|nr:hypothetical protein CNECB9_2540013 [Cupriavidus necator]
MTYSAYIESGNRTQRSFGIMS